MQLTDHFTLEELSATLHRGIDNTIPDVLIPKVRTLAHGLEHIRVLLGKPVIVLSGYRCLALNTLVGGAKDSQHMKGEAADFIVPAFGAPYEVCCALEASNLNFDQLIYEGTWVHCSFVDDKPRRSVLTWRKGQGYDVGLAGP